MYQYYVIIVTTDAQGYAHDVKWAFDADPAQARLKAESLYYTELAAAAVSPKLTHAVTLLSSEGVPLLNRCYKHPAEPEAATSEPVSEEPEAEPEPEPEPEIDNADEQEPVDETPVEYDDPFEGVD